MKVIICPDSFKGSFNSIKASSVIKNVFKKYFPSSKIVLFPLADGGEGSIDVLKKLMGGKFIRTYSTDPLGRKIKTNYLKKGKEAYIELAKEAGLPFLKNRERNPLETTTYGVGQVIRKAVSDGCKKINIFVGGSATNDAGIGALSALGVKFLDKKRRIIFPGRGKDLIKIREIDVSSVDKKFFSIKFNILTDVKNPLYGKDGAAYVYAPQKGASKRDIEILDNGLRNFSKVIKKSSGKDISKIEGTGAAGGFASGFISIFKAEVNSGIEFILKKGKFQEKLKESDIIITGEGKVDNQSFYGKVVGSILNYAEKYKIPVIVLAGIVEKGLYKNFKNDNVSIINITPAFSSYEEAMESGIEFLKIKLEQILKILKWKQKI